MALSNAICIIVTMMSTYWAMTSQNIPSSHIIKDIPRGEAAHDPLATNVNLSIDVKMSVEEEKHKVHNLLFSVPAHVLYDAILTVLTPMQAAKLRNDVRKATDTASQKILDVKSDEPTDELHILKQEKKDFLTPAATRFTQDRTMIETNASNEILKYDEKSSRTNLKMRRELHTSSLQISPSTTLDGQISTKHNKKNKIDFTKARKKKYFEVPSNSVSSASSTIDTKFRTLSTTFGEPLRSRLLSSPKLEIMAVSKPSQSPTVVCQLLDIEIKIDEYGSETTWKLMNDATDEVILTGGPYEEGPMIVYNDAACLYPGYYKFVIYDSYYDGIMDDGYYMLKLNGVTLHTGGQFGYKDVVPVKVTLPSEAISNKPSISSKPTTTSSPTMPPSKSNNPTYKPSLSLKPTATSLPTQFCTGEDQIQGQVRISSKGEYVTMLWDIFEYKSDMALFEGSIGVTDICVSKSGCYTFRIREGSQAKVFSYMLILGGNVHLEQYGITTNHQNKFGWRSCCKTNCCPTNQVPLSMSIYSNGPTEDLNWRLRQSQNNTTSIETLVMEGGQYDGNQDIYYTETCIDPRICHTLEILGDNETSSYKSIIIKIDGEIKTREYNVPSGSMIDFCSICSARPFLVTNYDNNFFADENEHNVFNARLREITQTLSHISRQEQLIDTSTAQYKAACWIIFDDLRKLQSDDPAMLAQRYVLALLYHATGGEDWMLRESESKYLTHDSECDWNDYDYYYEYVENGIECDEDGLVKKIKLENMKLKGQLPSEIASLYHLEELKLGSNSLEGNIPHELGRTKTLNVLDISDNFLTGTIPDSIFNLSELRTLNLKNNSLMGTLSTLLGKLYQLKELFLGSSSLTGSIPEEMFGIISLEQLIIAGNKLTGTIPSSIGWSIQLKYFGAENNMLSGTIPTTIGQLENLETFYVEYNHLTGSIPSEMGQLKNLGYAWLTGNQLKGIIPEEITSLNKLQELALSENLLEGTIPRNIGKMVELIEVYLNDNNFHGTIPSKYSKLHNLELLQLHGNSLEGTMPKGICKLRAENLKTLGSDCAYEYTPPEVMCECCSYCGGHFSNREREGTCQESELRIEMRYKDDNWISKHWSVKNGAKQIILSESYNDMIDVPPKTSYRACIAITDCLIFLIDGNKYHDEGTPMNQDGRNFHPYLSFSIYVNDYQIYNNDNSKNQIWHGKVNFGYSDSLKTSAVNQCDAVEYNNKTYPAGSREMLILNQISTISGGSIRNEESDEYQGAVWILSDDKHTYDVSDPFRIIQRYVLAVLYYSTNGKNWHNNTNYITDTNECEWAGVTCNNHSVLEGLNLRGNNIIGMIPYEIGQLSMLEHLDLSSNKGLNGTLPAEITNLWNIQTLNMSNCGISGSIPDKIWLWDNLKSLTMCCNDIAGSLPTEIGKAKKIESLDLHHNSMFGNLPKFSNETKLRELDLSSNYFGGKIIDAELQFEYFENFNLSGNVLTGPIPSDITTSISLKALDLSSNGLTGPIPSGLSNIKGLKALMLYGNKLRGTIPLEIYDITTLKKVVLQNNELTGTISTRIGKLKDLEQISLSNNNLKGILPSEIMNLKGSLKTLHVQFNELVGVTPWMENCNEWNKKRSFIADCGRPTTSLDPVECKCCTICCNSDGFCRSNEDSKFTPFQITFFIGMMILVFLILCACVSKYLKKRERFPLFRINVLKTIKEDSIYCFLLTNDIKCIFFALFVIIAQFAMFSSFLFAASFRTDGLKIMPEFQAEVDDWIYSKRCSPNSLECTDEKNVTHYGWFLFLVLMLFFMSKDLVMSIKLLYEAALSRSYRLFLVGATIMILTETAITASVYYNIAIAESDSQLVLNALLLTVFSQIDEEAMTLLITINHTWVKNKLREAKRCSTNIRLTGVHVSAELVASQQENTVTFELNPVQDEEEVKKNCNCCVFDLIIDMFRTYLR